MSPPQTAPERGEWQTGFVSTVRPARLVVDAVGQPLDNVQRAREVEGGAVEVECWLTDGEGNLLVGSADEGVTVQGVLATARIPGGQIFDLTEDDHE